MQTSQHLAHLVDWRDEVTLVPYSGTQILDFGFRLDALDIRNARYVERVVGGTDATPSKDDLYYVSMQMHPDHTVGVYAAVKRTK